MIKLLSAQSKDIFGGASCSVSYKRVLKPSAGLPPGMGYVQSCMEVTTCNNKHGTSYKEKSVNSYGHKECSF